MKHHLIMASVAALALVVGAGCAGTAAAANSKSLRNAVTLAGVRVHQAALQAIADANNGERASGTPGFAASVDYVKTTLEKAGYKVVVQPFDFPFFQEFSPAKLEQTAPGAVAYVNGTDFTTLRYSATTTPAGVTGVVQQVNDNVFPPTAQPSSTAGCEAADFDGFVPGNIALIQRGTCTFAEKVANAAAAGASAAIIFNEGNPGRTGLFTGTLYAPSAIPALVTDFALGSTLAGIGGLQLRVTTDTQSDIRSTANVIADTRGGRVDRIVVVGAHLDSVPGGPGINDNGSGTAGNLEIALKMAKLRIKPRNKVRFAFWGAEEFGLQGSHYYVSQLSAKQIKRISVNLNFDMLGSPNFGRFVYDGDGSDTGTAGPNGSATIERVFNTYFAKQALAVKSSAFDGRSDYGPFIEAGIPAGGLHTGAEVIKTTEDVALFGGTAGIAFDPCYHEACDTFANNSDVGLDQMVDAAADAVMQFAMTTAAVNGTSRAKDRTVSQVSARSLAYSGGELQR